MSTTTGTVRVPVGSAIVVMVLVMRFLCLCFSDVVGFSLAGIRDANKDFVTGSEIRDQVPNHSQQFGWVVGYDIREYYLPAHDDKHTNGRSHSIGYRKR